MNKYTSRMDADNMSCKDIFIDITSRQLVGLMFHDQMSTYFTFLGLDGFKRLHEYHYFEESLNHKCSTKLFVTRYGWLIETKNVVDPKVIPSEWFKYRKSEVSASIKQKAVKEGFELYLDWEKETKECYEYYVKALMDKGDISGSMYVEKLLCDVDKELKCIEKFISKMDATSYDMVYIVELQKHIHDKYKKKRKKLFD